MADFPCSTCSGQGTIADREGDIEVVSDCYHCLGTGKVEAETDRNDRLQRVAATLAYRAESQYRQARDKDPEGEDYTFCAAESMMSPADYFQSRVIDRTHDYVGAINRIDTIIQDALLEWLEKPKRNSEIPTMPPPPNDGMSLVAQEKAHALGRSLAEEQFFGNIAEDNIPF